MENYELTEFEKGLARFAWRGINVNDLTKEAKEILHKDSKPLLDLAMKEMKETLQTEYEKGRFDVREEMMKNAVEGEVVYQIGSAEIAPTDIRYKVVSDRVYIPNVKLGDKVKIIVIKPEQQ